MIAGSGQAAQATANPALLFVIPSEVEESLAIPDHEIE
jgi:hypothetical protein